MASFFPFLIFVHFCCFLIFLHFCSCLFIFVHWCCTCVAYVLHVRCMFVHVCSLFFIFFNFCIFLHFVHFYFLGCSKSVFLLALIASRCWYSCHCAARVCCSVSDVATAVCQFFPDSGMEHKNLGSIRLFLSLALNSSKGSDAQCLEPTRVRQLINSVCRLLQSRITKT